MYEGDTDGMNEGDDEGVYEGDTDGMDDGDDEGMYEGDTDGMNDGDDEGDQEGYFDGCTVGKEVGGDESSDLHASDAFCNSDASHTPSTIVSCSSDWAKPVRLQRVHRISLAETSRAPEIRNTNDPSGRHIVEDVSTPL